MKFLAIFSLFITANMMASEEVALEKCFKSTRRYYYQNGSPSDQRKEVHKVKFLKANEELKRLDDKVIAVYPEDMLIYQGSGSYHSGYFLDYIVVNAKTCEVEEILNIYSE